MLHMPLATRCRLRESVVDTDRVKGRSIYWRDGRTAYASADAPDAHEDDAHDPRGSQHVLGSMELSGPWSCHRQPTLTAAAKPPPSPTLTADIAAAAPSASLTAAAPSASLLAALRLASPSIATTATSPLSLTLATDAPLPAIATDAPPPSLTLTSDVPSHTLAADAPPLSPRLAAVLVHSRAAATALNGGVALVACAAD